MKFRIEKDSIKFRLTPGEIEILKSNQILTNFISISPENKFEYSIKPVKSLEHISLKFDAQTVLVLIPTKLLSDWFNSGLIGMKENLLNQDGKMLSIVIEEDLAPRKAKRPVS